jgi:ATP-dependent helicase HepA
LARWYDEGLNAFATPLDGGASLEGRFGRALRDLALEYPALDPGQAETELSRLIVETAEARERLTRELESGRDRLLEWNSYRPAAGNALVEAIRRQDGDPALEQFMLDVFEHYGVRAEETAPRTYRLNAQGATTTSFPAIPEDGVVATFDRSRALTREETAFLTLDHPMVTGALDLLLGSETGNCSVVQWNGAPQGGLWLETQWVLETVAPARLQADRYLPLTPLRVFVDREGHDRTEDAIAGGVDPAWTDLRPFPLLDEPALVRAWLPAMHEAARSRAEQLAAYLRLEGRRAMRETLGAETDRLRALRRINDHVRSEEIVLWEELAEALDTALREASVRLDAVRLIVLNAQDRSSRNARR